MMEQRTKESAGNNSEQMLKNLVFISIVSADNDNYTEEVKQEILRRHDISDNWDYILEPLGDEAYRYKTILKRNVSQQ